MEGVSSASTVAVVHGRSQQAGTGPEHLVVGPVAMKLTESVGLTDRSVAVAA